MRTELGRKRNKMEKILLESKCSAAGNKRRMRRTLSSGTGGQSQGALKGKSSPGMKQGNFPATPKETGNVLIHLLSSP